MEMKYGLVKSLRISATWTCLPLEELLPVLLPGELLLPAVLLLDELPELQAARASPPTAPRTASLANLDRDLSLARTTM
jgi:hypothetical protein